VLHDHSRSARPSDHRCPVGQLKCFPFAAVERRGRTPEVAAAEASSEPTLTLAWCVRPGLWRIACNLQPSRHIGQSGGLAFPALSNTAHSLIGMINSLWGPGHWLDIGLIDWVIGNWK
jgi:hypothetical protein